MKPALALAFAAVLVSAGCSGRSAGAASASSREPSSIQCVGSDTLVNLALAWAESWMAAHPEARISVTGGGSGTGIAALAAGTADIANASREMSAEEIATARANGIEPVRHSVALDAIAVVAHPSNPVSSLTLEQVSAVYTGRITRWAGLGGEDRPIVLLSRESNSGTYVYFLEQVIRLGRKDSKDLFSPETLLMPSSEGISAEVRQNRNAIGYDGLGYVTADQKTIAIARDPDSPFVLPSAATVIDGTYPVSRPLFMYTAGVPAGAVKEFLDFVTGEGQGIVAGLGFIPLQGDGR
ncbi:MAG: phosphate ABC transporter substrate-binding protein [Spirochaetes bacterium]|nr:phosphate ABC transporter substrate-binding protein [Spirochaetota bacterium]